MSNKTPSSPSGGRKQFMAMPPGDVAKTNDPKRFEARPQFKQQTFDEIYGAPENFLEIEVRGECLPSARFRSEIYNCVNEVLLTSR